MRCRVGMSMVMALGLVVAVACGAIAEQTTLTVFVRTGLNPLEEQLQATVFKLFEQENPNIKLRLVNDAGSPNYTDKLIALWAAGDPPDVWDHGGPVMTYAKDGWLLDLAPFVARDKAAMRVDDFLPAAWRAYERDGRIWGIPFAAGASYLTYNADLFDQAGLSYPPIDWGDQSWNWTKVKDYARKLVQRDANGTMTRAGFGFGRYSYLNLPYIWAYGGDWFDAETYRTGVLHKPTLDAPNTVRAMEEIQAMVHELRIAPENMGWDAAAFAEGRVGMHMGEGVIFGKTEAEVGFRWGIAPFPAGTQVSPSIIYTDPWMISAKTKVPEAAWAFVKFMTGPRVAQEYMKVASFTSARKSFISPQVEQLAKQTKHQTREQVLSVIASAHGYGREALDHVITDFQSRLVPAIQPAMDAIWNNEKAARVALSEAQRVVEGIAASMKK